MSEQPALKADAVASFIVTVRDLVKAERERDVAEAQADNIAADLIAAERERDAARAERDKALAEVERGKRHCDEAVKLWRDLYREAIGIPPSEHQARRMEEMAATSERVVAERDEALRLHVEDHARIYALLIERDEAVAALARVRALADESPWGTTAATLRAALEGP